MANSSISKSTYIGIAVIAVAAIALSTCGKKDETKIETAVTSAEQFFPVLVYRTGAYAPNGVPWANGFVDYLKLTNARGGINGVKISFEECETGYATDRGVEC
jgi:branched-chain amino acid transport system substrate-binding protein